MPPIVFLTLLIFSPAIGALALAVLIPKENEEAARNTTLVITAFVFVLSVVGFFWGEQTKFDTAALTMQSAFNVPWIPSFDIYYFLGIDGISFPLVMLTTLICFLAMWASWSIKKHVKGYCILFLLLETGMIGVFMALDFFLFYVFWEVMLLPMYFLIGIWGGPRREYAALKFFLYTLVGSVLMLIAILLLYFNSDLRELAKHSDFYGEKSAVKWADLNVDQSVARRLGRISNDDLNLHAARGPHLVEGDLQLRFVPSAEAKKSVAYLQHEEVAPGQPSLAQTVVVELPGGKSTSAEVVTAMKENFLADGAIAVSLIDDEKADTAIQIDEEETLVLPSGERLDRAIHTFNIQALAAMGQHTTLFSNDLQWWAFLLLLIGFLIKVPAVPVHTWLPDAHVEAPTPISMILAGVLLKMGGYGIIRICYPICPHGGYDLMYFVCGLGVVSMIYGAFAALAQKDFKRLVAYSSVSHMGYVVLGFGVWSAVGPTYNADYWKMGMQGAMFQMIGHGISSAGMFFMVGIIYDRVHHRNLAEFGGLYGKMPFYTAMAMGIFFAGLGLPGLCGFIGEVFVVLSVWNFNYILAIVAASTVVLTAGYILWAIQRVYLGAEYRGPHPEGISPTNFRERTIGVTLLVFAIIFGVFPYQTVLKYMDKTIDHQAESLADWTKKVKEAGDYESGEEGDTATAATPSSDKTNVVRGQPAEPGRRTGPAGQATGTNDVVRSDQPGGPSLARSSSQ